MSVDLLRRAATKLREAAEAASPGSWNNDGWEIYAGHVGLRADWIGETCAGEHDQDSGNGSYIALMHPPVALALAELLDRAADTWPIDIAEPPRNPRDRAMSIEAVAVACAVLREVPNA